MEPEMWGDIQAQCKCIMWKLMHSKDVEDEGALVQLDLNPGRLFERLWVGCTKLTGGGDEFTTKNFECWVGKSQMGDLEDFWDQCLSDIWIPPPTPKKGGIWEIAGRSEDQVWIENGRCWDCWERYKKCKKKRKKQGMQRWKIKKGERGTSLVIQ